MAFSNSYGLLVADFNPYLSRKQQIGLTNDGCVDPDSGTVDETILEPLLNDAIGTVESFLRKNYVTPFVNASLVITLPAEIKGMMIRLAIYFLCQRKNIMNDLRETQYIADMDRLKEWERDDDTYQRFNIKGVRAVRKNK